MRSSQLLTCTRVACVDVSIYALVMSSICPPSTAPRRVAARISLLRGAVVTLVMLAPVPWRQWCGGVDDATALRAGMSPDGRWFFSTALLPG